GGATSPRSRSAPNGSNESARPRRLGQPRRSRRVSRASSMTCSRTTSASWSCRLRPRMTSTTHSPNALEKPCRASRRPAVTLLRSSAGCSASSAVTGQGTRRSRRGLDGRRGRATPVGGGGPDAGTRSEGGPGALPAGIDLSAYRVVQEALTNTLKHARASRAEVSLRFRPNGLDVDVRDDGVGAGNGDGAGSGLIGMRERVAVYGGSFTAGPDPGGGFAVSARFPVEAAL